MATWLIAVFWVGWAIAFVKLLPQFSIAGRALAGLAIAAPGVCIYAMSCLFIVPLLPLWALATLSIALEWQWRLVRNRPWTPPPPPRYVPPVIPVA